MKNREAHLLRVNDGKPFCHRVWYRVLVFILFAVVIVDAETIANQQRAKETAQDKSQSPSAAPSALDTAHWNTLKNKYGWKIKYPKDWVPDEEAPISGIVTFFGPGDCTKERCVSFQVDSEIFQDEGPQGEDFGPDNNPSKFLSYRRYRLGGFPALDVIFHDANTNGYTLVRGVTVNHSGRLLGITYTEGGKDKDAIKLPPDWKYTSNFNQILDTLSFYDVPKSVWPKPRSH
jgi:PsbP-like protein